MFSNEILKGYVLNTNSNTRRRCNQEKMAMKIEKKRDICNSGGSGRRMRKKK